MATGFVIKNNMLSAIATDHQRGGILLEYGGQGTMVYNNIVEQSAVGISSYHIPVASWENILFVSNSLWANSVGIYEAGSENQFINNIVSASSLSGIQVDNVSSTSVFSHNNVYANGINYLGLADATGTDGNISADPRYADPAAGDFDLQQCSAAIDAGSGTVAPSLDKMSNSRFDDPNTVDTGSGSYSYADLGALEYQGGTGESRLLNVIVTGGGQGVVASEPGGMLCNTSCSVAFVLCADIVLTASPDPDSQFVGWAGACNGTEFTCTVNMNAEQDVAADFCALHTFYNDKDNDTYGDPADFIRACTQPDGYVENQDDCDDNDDTISPAAIELCDGRDNDCSAAIDDAFPQLGDDCTAGVGACAASGSMVCSGDTLSTVCDAEPGTPVDELCDGLDNDCDGQTDEEFPLLGEACSEGIGFCYDTGFFVCQPDGLDVICDAELIQPEMEVCDGQDNDCDGQVDEAPCFVFSDIDGDEDRDGRDIALFIPAYINDYGPLGPEESSSANINLDSMVDAADIAAFAGDFGKVAD